MIGIPNLKAAFERKRVTFSMKSVKPGRGPSAMNAVGSIAVGIFGVFWTIGVPIAGSCLGNDRRGEIWKSEFGK